MNDKGGTFVVADPEVYDAAGLNDSDNCDKGEVLPGKSCKISKVRYPGT